MSLRTLVLAAAIAGAALPALAQNTPENRAAEAAYRAQVEAEARAADLQRQQIDMQIQQRETQQRLEALETQRRWDDILRQPAAPTTNLTVVEQERQRDLDQRLTTLEQQQRLQEQTQQRQLQQQQQLVQQQYLAEQQRQRLATLTAPGSGAAAPVRLTPFGVQPDFGSASDAERQAAAGRYTACLLRNARALDDRVSDAATVAMAVQPNCRAEYDGWRSVMSRGAAQNSLAALNEALESGAQAGAVQAVLESRRSAR